jgi:anaerobic magnesium-protoporphyrin IX monomethyl ester cyclase
LEFLIKHYGIKSFIIDDDNIVADKERARKFFQMLIDKKLGLRWNSISMAVFKLNEEMLELMKKSGCEYLNIAIESGVPRVLRDIIHKPIDLEQAKRMVKKMKELGIDVAANFIIGFPGEKWEEIRQTINYAEELDANYTKVFIATPLPNTELYMIALTKGYLTKNWKGFNEHLWTDGYIETDEFRPQDLKILRAYEWDRINFSKPEKRIKICQMMGITEQRLGEIRKNTFKRANP